MKYLLHGSPRKEAIRSELMALQAWRAANANPIASIEG